MLNIQTRYLFLIAPAILILGWPPFPTAFLLFIGFVPLLMIHYQLLGEKRRHLKFMGWTYLVMLIFNSGSTWWVWNASPSGCLIMLFANSLIMSLPFLLFSFTHSVLPKTGFWSLLFYYPAMEYIHFNWSASWPWLTLGKGLAVYPWFIQWYEYIGEMGGTVLIISLNIWIFKIVRNAQYKKLWQPGLTIALVYGISMLAASFANSIEISNNDHSIECVVSQPNIDPYEEKFGDGVNVLSPEDQLSYAMDVAAPLMTSQTRLLVLPETAIVGWNDESRINELILISSALRMTDSTGLVILAGAETYNAFKTTKSPTITARYDSFSSTWWDSYNTALLMKNNRVDSMYHKSKLVPGVEKMPFDFLEKLSINLGGSSGSLATSKHPINFIVNPELKIAPLICYESVFGDYVNEFVRDGANALAVITNDGWWGNTPGYKQHLLFGAIRCIETRKEMVRSANTGVSAKIDIYGHISQRTKYDERTAFRCFIKPNNYLTFYVRYGNLIGKVSCLLTIIFLISGLVIHLLRKGK